MPITTIISTRTNALGEFTTTTQHVANVRPQVTLYKRTRKVDTSAYLTAMDWNTSPLAFRNELRQMSADITAELQRATKRDGGSITNGRRVGIGKVVFDVFGIDHADDNGKRQDSTFNPKDSIDRVAMDFAIGVLSSVIAWNQRTLEQQAHDFGVLLDDGKPDWVRIANRAEMFLFWMTKRGKGLVFEHALGTTNIKISLDPIVGANTATYLGIRASQYVQPHAFTSIPTRATKGQLLVEETPATMAKTHEISEEAEADAA